MGLMDLMEEALSTWTSRYRCGVQTYRFELPFLEDLWEDEAPQRHRHDEDEGERQRGHGRLDNPQGHDARQLRHGEHVHTPCLHLKQHKCRFLLKDDTNTDKLSL